MAFPQLLKNSKFATFDPSITRIYTTTPHSINKYHDFGTKYPVVRRKLRRYIKLSNFDAGRMLGGDWRSGETEYRFVEAYGNGRTPWKHEDEVKARSNAQRINYNLFGTAEVEPEEYMEDVNTMQPHEFKKYLARIKAARKDLLQDKIDSLDEMTRRSLTLEEDRTFVNLAARGHLATPDTWKAQVKLAQRAAEDPESTKIQSQPHRLYGLSYSRIPQTASEHTSILFHPGRAIEPSQYGRSTVSGTNRQFVVSAAGITGASYAGGYRISDRTAIQNGIDFSRENRSEGEGMFRVASARVSEPPQVVNAGKLGILPGQHGRFDFRKPSPTPSLDTFKFDIQFEHVPQQTIKSKEIIGTRDWVGRDGRSGALRLQDWMGLSEPASSRQSGETLRSLRAAESAQAQETRLQGSAQIAKILAKLAKKTTPEA